MKSARRAAIFVSGVLLAGGVAFAQQPPQPTTKPQPSQPARPQTSQPSQSGLQALDGQTVTVTGCLVREADAPGQQPTPTERAGILRDFILTNVQVKSAAPAGGGKPGETTRDMPSTAGGKGTNVKLTEIDNDKAEPNLNRQVEVTGRLDVEGSAQARPTTPAPSTPPPSGTRASGSQRELPELQVQSMKVVSQSCPKQ